MEREGWAGGEARVGVGEERPFWQAGLICIAGPIFTWLLKLLAHSSVARFASFHLRCRLSRVHSFIRKIAQSISTNYLPFYM